MRWLRRVSVLACGALVACVALLAGCLAQVPALAATSATSTAGSAAAAASGGQSASKAGAKAALSPARLPDPAGVLPSGWQHSSDEAVTVSGDAAGLHVLEAREASGYAWRTVATLGDPAVQTDLWIGQACVTAAGRYAVVVYAPEQAANAAEEQGVLGRAAIVDLATGAVKDLGGGFSIAYFDPGCGTGSTVALTKGGWANDTSNAPMTTTLVLANAATGKVAATVKVAGQVTSAIPYRGQIAAAGGRELEQISTAGKTRLLVATAAVPFRLTPAADGSLGYQTMVGQKTVDVWRLAGGRPGKVASAPAGSVELRQIGGRTWLVGLRASKLAGLPGQWQPVDAPTIAQPSTTGTLAVTDAETTAPVKGQHYDPASPQPVTVSTQLLAGKRGTASFKVAAAAAPMPAPAAGTAKVVTTALVSRAASRAAVAVAATTPGSPSTPVSADRTCAVALDDPTVQAYQPTFKQVEWAADQAVQGTLTDTRPAGLHGSSLASYTPQGLFPLPAVSGGGGNPLPPQVLLGVLTAESNLQQASMHVIQGQTANPLNSFNWYGNWTNGETNDTGLVNWQNSDCGYGIGQITSGMCLAGNPNGNNECAGQTSTTLTSQQQLAATVDYQANIAAAARLLIQEWNNLLTLGITPTGPGIPAGGTYSQYVGEWYMAIWAYNSGLEPGSPKYGNTTGCSPSSTCTDGAGNWGLGYADNPIDPTYPPDRPLFNGSSSNPTPTGTTYTPSWDASHPQYWPYQEKVIAWGFNAITLWDYSQGKDVQAYAWAHGTTMVPPYAHFCVPGPGSATTPGDNCDSTNVDPTKPTAPDSCQLTGNYIDHCWWHYPNGWQATTPTTSCSNCGQGVITYAAGAADPGPEPIAAKFAQTCASNLPSTAVIVGDGGKSALGCPGQNWTSQGSFTWNFAADANGHYSSKIYFDQIGAGFGGHFWFGYAQPAAEPAQDVITGTWNPPSSVSGWTDIKVAIPSYGANAAGANYQVNPGGGAPVRDVQIDQSANSGTNAWVDLGSFDLGSGASVSLSNVTPNTITIGVGVSGSDLAWSAAAFLPVAAPAWTYTAMGDSYSSGVGGTYDQPNDGCDRSSQAFGRQFAVANSGIGQAGIQHIACSGSTIENLTTSANNGEQPQISQMFSGTKLVTVTIGGNDIGFASVLTYCLFNPQTCESQYNTDNATNLYTIIDTLGPNLVDAYQAMQAAAPKAKIIAVTYPLLFQPGTACLGLTVPDVNFLNNVGEYLDNAIVAAAHKAGIKVMDERYAFATQQLCSPNVTTPLIYAPPNPFPTGDQVLDSSSWFHPNAAGQKQIADDLAAYWSAMQAGTAGNTWPPADTPDPTTGWLSPNLPAGIPSTGQAETMLDSLPQLDAPASTAGYSTSNLVTQWPSTRNGCTTRNRVLITQALTPAQNPVTPLGSGTNCTVFQGTWYIPYEATPTQQAETSQTGIAADLPIDHLVARANAWIDGANNWTQYGAQGSQMMTDFANDLGGPELLVVSNASNLDKSDSPPQKWMPANEGMWCTFAKMWIAVKWEWNLGVDLTAGSGNNNPSGQNEYDYLNGILQNDCSQSG